MKNQEKQHFRKNAPRKYQVFLIFFKWSKYQIFRKTKIKENVLQLSIVFVTNQYSKIMTKND